MVEDGDGDAEAAADGRRRQRRRNGESGAVADGWRTTERWCRRRWWKAKQVPPPTDSLMSSPSTSALPSSLCRRSESDIRSLHGSSLYVKFLHWTSRLQTFEKEGRVHRCPIRRKTVCRFNSICHFLRLYFNTMYHINTCGLLLRSAANSTSAAYYRQTYLNCDTDRRAPDVENLFEHENIHHQPPHYSWLD